jgi:dTMP kinase
MFIVFEGIDGSGKSTQARLLSDFFESQGIPFILTHEPSDGIIGQKLRSLASRLKPEEESRLFLEDRVDHVKAVINPAMIAGQHVICDRYYYSSAAYQGALGLDSVEVLDYNRSMVPEPDVVFLMVVSVETALKRIGQSRSAGFSVFEKRNGLEAVSGIYDTFQDHVIKRIDGEQTVSEVHEEIVNWLKLHGVGA